MKRLSQSLWVKEAEGERTAWYFSKDSRDFMWEGEWQPSDE